jgi:7,8-dihydroneopterin aldolase/epimerase/oxygenase
MSDRVTVGIRGLEVFGRHGVFPEERSLGQRFVIDVDIEMAGDAAARTDALTDTVDYSTLCDAIVDIVAGPPVALLERLAGLIADRVLQEALIEAVVVTVRKPHVALRHSVAETSVTLRRERG